MVVGLRCEAGPRAAPLQTVNPDTGHPKPTFKSHFRALSDRQSQNPTDFVFKSIWGLRIYNVPTDFVRFVTLNKVNNLATLVPTDFVFSDQMFGTGTPGQLHKDNVGTRPTQHPVYQGENRFRFATMPAA